MRFRCQRPVITSSGRFKNLGCRTFPLSRFRVLTPSTNLYGFAWHVLSHDSVGIFSLFPMFLFSLQLPYSSWWHNIGYHFPRFMTEGTYWKNCNTISSHGLQAPPFGPVRWKTWIALCQSSSFQDIFFFILAISNSQLYSSIEIQPAKISGFEWYLLPANLLTKKRWSSGESRAVIHFFPPFNCQLIL